MPNPKYFQHFPTKSVEYMGIKQKIKDLSRYVRVVPDVIQSKYAFYDYVIKDGERPDHVAYKAYGDSKYYWVILISNNIRDIWREWPLSTKQFQHYIKENYGSISNAQTCLHHYETNDGIVIDDYTASEMDVEDYSPVTCYQYEDGINEEKRSIKIIRPEYLSDFQEEIKNLFEGSE